MFRPRDPQSSLFTSSALLPDEKRQRLEREWPGEFRRSVLPLIDEEIFRDLYCADNGRPNKPVQTIVALLILKEIEDLTDMQALYRLDFDLGWHVALDLEPGETHCCQKTLHNFRARLMRDDRARVLFEDKRIAKLESYGLLERLFHEQCEVVEEAQAPAEGDADALEPLVPVVVKEAKKVRSDSMQSPHDPDMTYNAHKGKGCEVQIAETTGNGEAPEIITYADVTRSCESDEKATVPVVDDLAAREIQPSEMVADTNYGSTANVIELARKGTELVAPVAGHEPAAEEKPKTVAHETAADGRTDAVCDAKTGTGAPRPDDGRKIDKGEFDIDVRGERRARCPAGREAVEERSEAGTGKVRLVFGAHDCATCPLAEGCPAKRRKNGTRVLKTTFHKAALARRRWYQRTAAFRERYATRAGIEATNSELKRVHGLGRLRIRGLLRVRLAVRLKALACNVKRMVNHLAEKARSAARLAVAAAEEAAAVA